MTSEIFKKMRDTFGHEECEFCGRLFYSKADYEPHLRTHTGWYNITLLVQHLKVEHHDNQSLLTFHIKQGHSLLFLNSCHLALYFLLKRKTVNFGFAN